MKTDTARILTVDDDPALTRLLCRILEQENYRVLAAGDGGEGLRMAGAERPDLILLDLNLPDMSGLEVCRQLKASAATCAIPVIFLTAAEQEENECRCFEEGAVDFLRKPVSRAQLCVRVRNALEIMAARTKLERQARDMEKSNASLKTSLIMQEQVRRNFLLRDQVLCTVNYVAKAFLQTSRWRDVIGDALAYLGKTVGCEHAYLRIFASSRASQPDYVWCSAPGCGGRRSSIDLLATWQRPPVLFADRRPIISPDPSLPSSVRQQLDEHGIRTCLVLPVHVGQMLHGCLGFDCRTVKRSWDTSLVRAMQTSADIIGSAMQRARESKERSRLAAAINEFVDCVLMTDESGCVFYANPACRQVTGYMPEELVGSSFSDIQFDELHRISCQEILELAGRQEWRGEMRNHQKDGTLYDEAVTVIPVRGEEGRVSSFCIIKRDQTEKKRLESIAEAANLMENVGFVFSGIRHELANPLNSLKMALSVLRRQIDSLRPDKVREFLDRSLGEISRVEYLLTSLKNFNLLEKQQAAPVDLTAFLKNFKRLHEEELKEKGIRLDVITTGGTLCGLVDERALHQVMLNLLTNSVSALERRHNPAIFISLMRKKRNFIHIRFQDNGCGLSEETKKRLFKPFFTTKVNGTGLGLTIVKKMLTAMNCTVTMDGKEGGGAWVIITVPEGGTLAQDSGSSRSSE
jgi:PAS domain S-box-containing protein